VEDDGSTKIDGETGITTNAQGQTTNVGGSAGITIGNPAPAKAEGAAPVRPPGSIYHFYLHSTIIQYVVLRKFLGAVSWDSRLRAPVKCAMA
jgi:hypothetical protein